MKPLGQRLAAVLRYLAAPEHDVTWTPTTTPCRIDDAMHADVCPGEHPALQCSVCGLVVDQVDGRTRVTA